MAVSAKFRVVHVNTAGSWRGGERQVLLLARGLLDRGHAVLLVCQPGSPLSERARADGLGVTELAMRGEWDLVAGARLAGIVRRFAAQLCHLHTAHAHSLGLLARLWGRMPPSVVSRRVDFRPRRNPFSVWKYRCPRLMYAAVSENVREVLISSGVDGSRVRTIHSGIPVEAVERIPDRKVWQEWGIDAAKRIVISVAALAPHKDHATLLKAAAKVVKDVPEAHFVLVGSGPLVERVRHDIEALGLEDHVTLTGFRNDVGALLGAAEVFVSASWLEGLGTSILDAMAVGLPVVATRVGGIPEMVRDGREGRLVAARNPDALADALQEILSSPEEIRRMSRAATLRASEFDISETVNKTEGLYSETLERYGTARS